MFNISTQPKEILSMEYHFEDENLDLEIRDPQEIEVLDTGYHVIEDSEGFVFIIRPEWMYISVLKRRS